MTCQSVKNKLHEEQIHNQLCKKNRAVITNITSEYSEVGVKQIQIM